MPYAQFIEELNPLLIAVAARLIIGFGVSRFSFSQTLNGGESTLILDGYAVFSVDFAAQHRVQPAVYDGSMEPSPLFGDLCRKQVRKHRGGVVVPCAPSRTES